MSIFDWEHAFDTVDLSHQITLGEANTPLVRSKSVGPSNGLSNLYFKLDHCNPTGSFKDRYAAVAVSHMMSAGETKCVATSSGNTGASLAAYCARAGISCRIAIVETAPLGKLQQMMSYGADIYRIEGFGIDVEATAKTFALLEAASDAQDTALQVSAFRYSPLGMSGIRSIAYEIQMQLDAVDHVFCQAGGGGLAIGAAQGYLQLHEEGSIDVVPKVHVVQPTGNDTIATPLRDGDAQARDIQCTTKVSGLQVASVTDGHIAVTECRKTDGTGYLVEDEFVWKIQKDLARSEGVFCEPAAAVSVCGAINALQMGEIQADDVIVCPITGSGFKDPKSVERLVSDLDCPIVSNERFEDILAS